MEKRTRKEYVQLSFRVETELDVRVRRIVELRPEKYEGVTTFVRKAMEAAVQEEESYLRLA